MTIDDRIEEEWKWEIEEAKKRLAKLLATHESEQALRREALKAKRELENERLERAWQLEKARREAAEAKKIK